MWYGRGMRKYSKTPKIYYNGNSRYKQNKTKPKHSKNSNYLLSVHIFRHWAKQLTSITWCNPHNNPVSILILPTESQGLEKIKFGTVNGRARIQTQAIWFPGLGS